MTLLRLPAGVSILAEISPRAAGPASQPEGGVASPIRYIGIYQLKSIWSFWYFSGKFVVFCFFVAIETYFQPVEFKLYRHDWVWEPQFSTVMKFGLPPSGSNLDAMTEAQAMPPAEAAGAPTTPPAISVSDIIATVPNLRTEKSPNFTANRIFRSGCLRDRTFMARRGGPRQP
jgi:hypothetical protein